MRFRSLPVLFAVLLYCIALPFGTAKATSLARSALVLGAASGQFDGVVQVQRRRRRRRFRHLRWASRGWGHFRGPSRRVRRRFRRRRR